ncbi:helix-turn-helix domain-containing protein [Ammoniphilus sp. 3BR4]|uniref:helix-turn-helix domain-containing protein n=1 Tax=Ammoniphilus sp. 3BR4 TaxID=3158265 RepID=UPI0034664AB2
MLADKLLELRIKKGVSQEEVARRIGISNSVLSRIERGKRDPTYTILIKLVDYYGVSFDDVMDLDKNFRIENKY